MRLQMMIELMRGSCLSSPGLMWRHFRHRFRSVLLSRGKHAGKRPHPQCLPCFFSLLFRGIDAVRRRARAPLQGTGAGYARSVQGLETAGAYLFRSANACLDYREKYNSGINGCSVVDLLHRIRCVVSVSTWQ